MDLRERLHLAFLRRLVATAEGRAHVLTMIADAEGSDEAAIFERTLAQVDDPGLAKMIRKHQADEQRHEELFRACAARAGAPAPSVPAHLRILDRIADATGHFLERPITDGKGVMEAYALLQVIEERAIAQFALLERAFRDVDPATADTFVEVARDEERHLKYCQAIARRYAPDERTREATLERLRRVEAEAFAANSRANMEHIFANGWFQGGAVAKLAWRAVAALQRRRPAPTAVEQRAWQRPMEMATA